MKKFENSIENSRENKIKKGRALPAGSVNLRILFDRRSFSS